MQPPNVKKRLEKAGFFTKKGTFGAVEKGKAGTTRRRRRTRRRSSRRRR